MSLENAISALRELAKGSARSKTARLRDVFDEVEASCSAGVSHASIIDVLRKEGLEFTPRGFAVTLSRIRNERIRKDRVTPKNPGITSGLARESAPQQHHAARAATSPASLTQVPLNSDLSVPEDVYESFKSKD